MEYGSRATAYPLGQEQVEYNVPRMWGRAALLLCALLNGSLSVIIKFIFSTDGPPRASAFSAARGLLAALFLSLVMVVRPKPSAQPKGEAQALLEAQLPADKDPAPPPPSLSRAAAELALWNVGAQGLLNAGLVYTSANRGSFFLQLSVVITPLLEGCAGQRVRVFVWFGALLSLLGLCFLTFRRITDIPQEILEAGDFSRFNVGDALCLGGAFSWSFYVIRLGRLANGLEEVPLQCRKNVFMTVYYLAWALVEWIMLMKAAGDYLPISILWPGWTGAFAICCLLYTAIFPGALEDVLQQKGQKVTEPADANVILSMEPLFTVLLSFLIVHDVLDSTQAMGGLLILVGTVLASMA